MHSRYYFDVTNGISFASSNTLTITISSPLRSSATTRSLYPYTLPSSDGPRYFPNRNFIRKAQSDFGWDWGPSFAPSGVWKDVGLVGVSSSVMTNLVVQQYHQLESGDVWLRVLSYMKVLNRGEQDQICVSVQLASGSSGVIASNCTTIPLPPSSPDLLGETLTELWLIVPAEQVQLWWPVGYGTQPLYAVTSTFTDSSSSTSLLSRTIGLRTVELIRESGPSGQAGKSFYFRINQLEIFIKGANLVPLDVFHTRVTSDNITSLLDSLLEANGNTVRVWGGGIYQQDVLYDYADQKGILVWQEYAFACATYPRDLAFLESVRQEVAYQTRRLSSHASILIFGGNNENEQALTWFLETIQNRDIYLVDYVKLMLDTVMDQHLRETRGELPFVTSSPSRGPLSEKDPYVQLWGAPQSEENGDMHYYNYPADCSDIRTLPRPRFVSEFGFQSLPSIETWSNVLSEEDGDFIWNSTMMLYHQRHPSGNDQLQAQLERHFQLPNTTESTIQLFEDWIYLTQSVQSLCYRTALQYWRSIKHTTPGRTMGILYWQLNDIWQGTTWSSIEYGGRWKMLQYVVKRTYAQVLVSGYYNKTNDVISVYVTSDLSSPLTGELQFTVSSWISGDLLAGSFPFTLASLDSQMIYDITAQELFMSQAGCPTFVECYLTVGAVNVTVTDTRDNDTTTIIAQSSEIFVTPLRDSPLQLPSLTFSNFTSVLSSSGDNIIAATFTLSTDFAAPYIFLSTLLAGRFDDNGFVLGHAQNRTVMFTPSELDTFTVEQLQATLKVRTLAQTYMSANEEST